MVCVNSRAGTELGNLSEQLVRKSSMEMMVFFRCRRFSGHAFVLKCLHCFLCSSLFTFFGLVDAWGRLLVVLVFLDRKQIRIAINSPFPERVSRKCMSQSSFSCIPREGLFQGENIIFCNYVVKQFLRFFNQSYDKRIRISEIEIAVSSYRSATCTT